MKTLFTLTIIALLISCNKSPEQKIDLPEEYKLITEKDALKAHFDKDSTLIIEFDNYPKPEYIIELLDEESVIIRTPDTIYYTVFDSINEVILNDNL